MSIRNREQFDLIDRTGPINPILAATTPLFSNPSTSIVRNDPTLRG